MTETVDPNSMYAKSFDRCRGEFIRGGAIGAVQWGVVANAGLLAAHKFLPAFRKANWRIKLMLGSSAFIAGFWVRSERAALDCQQQVYWENHPELWEEWVAKEGDRSMR